MLRITPRHGRSTLVAGAIALALLGGCSASSDDAMDEPAPADSAAQAEEAGAADAGSDGADRDLAGEDSQAAAAPAAGEGESGVDPVSQNLPEGRMIARDAQLGIAVEDVNESAAQVRAAAVAADGWVVSEELSPDNSAERFDGFATLVLSVPGDRLDATLDQLGPTGRLTSRVITSLDVTQDFTDTSARIETLEASVTRVRGLLEDAGGIEDIVFLERELADREAELDVLKAHVKGLEADVARSSITVHLTETDPAEAVQLAQEEEPTGFAAGLSAGWDAFLSGVAFVLTAIGALLPFAIVAALILAPVLWWRRRRASADQRAAEPVPVPSTEA
ncbi:DUF4349 domain-containing protein [Ornithinimicrobium cryptoxanthini]|uniref:DUF4349 domain-containing protein n=1 Tax=Ornithinimicrobium cryptoxanthini TaxID=2934161 RepID=A0ABY4YLP3_9MICO|nr:DUF4349 domain-containing protein [Ornithinimicrobium cryptoxanthini]USQ77698.1 DUF4349 domain-containing protein [Ornithinimicrobium cryptoxanthini]